MSKKSFASPDNYPEKLIKTKNFKIMKKIVLLLVVLFSATICSYAQTENYKYIKSYSNGSDNSVRAFLDTISKGNQEGFMVDSLMLDYIEAFGNRKHDQGLIKDGDNYYFVGRTIEGFFVGASIGASYTASASAFSYVAGLELGYSFWWGDFLVTGRVGNDTFNGMTYFAPSAFAEARFNLVHWGKVKDNRFYIGARVGYQHTQGGMEIGSPDDDLYLKQELKGSGFAYGLVTGYEWREFLGGNRVGVQLAAYTYDMQQGAYGTIDGVPVIDADDNSQGWRIELSVRYCFQFGKTKSNITQGTKLNFAL